MTHTQGPWVVREPEDDGLHEVYAESGGDLICFPVWTHNQKANIPLIAAAPEMLTALCEARDAFAALNWEGEENWRHWDATQVDQLIAGTLHVVNQVIAKAEGLTKEGSNGEDRRMD